VVLPNVLPGLLSGFHDLHPDATIEVLEAAPDHLTAALEEGALDLAITYDLDLPDGWQRAPFASLVPHVILPRDHPLADGPDAIDLGDLAGDPMVLLDVAPSAKHAHDCCRAAGFVPEVALRARTYETVRAFVGRGYGWTLLVSRAASLETAEGREVVVKQIAAPALPTVQVCVLWHPRAMLNRASRTFVSHTLAHGSSLVGGPLDPAEPQVS
jgi:DNA-binding transcriptional LysR family regulator